MYLKNDKKKIVMYLFFILLQIKARIKNRLQQISYFLNRKQKRTKENKKAKEKRSLMMKNK